MMVDPVELDRAVSAGYAYLGGPNVRPAFCCLKVGPACAVRLNPGEGARVVIQGRARGFGCFSCRGGIPTARAFFPQHRRRLRQRP